MSHSVKTALGRGQVANKTLRANAISKNELKSPSVFGDQFKSPSSTAANRTIQPVTALE